MKENLLLLKDLLKPKNKIYKYMTLKSMYIYTNISIFINQMTQGINTMIHIIKQLK